MHHAKHWQIHHPGRSHDRQSQRPSSTIFAGGNLCLCPKRCPEYSQQPLDHRSLAVLGTLLTNEYGDIHLRRPRNEQRPSHAVSMVMGDGLGSYGERKVQIVSEVKAAVTCTPLTKVDSDFLILIDICKPRGKKKWSFSKHSNICKTSNSGTHARIISLRELLSKRIAERIRC